MVNYEPYGRRKNMSKYNNRSHRGGRAFNISISVTSIELLTFTAFSKIPLVATIPVFQL